MYIIKELNGELVPLNKGDLNDYCVEALRSRGANDDEISEVREGISRLKDNEQCNISFDGKDLFAVRKSLEGKELDEALDKIIDDINITQNKYLIIFDEDMKEPVIINIDDNINRPNCPDGDEIIADFIEDNYGGTGYNSIKIDGIKSFRVK